MNEEDPKKKEIEELIKQTKEYKKKFEDASISDKVQISLGRLEAYLISITQEENKKVVFVLLNYSIDRINEAKELLEQIKSEKKIEVLEIIKQVLNDIQTMKKTEIPEIIERMAKSAAGKVVIANQLMEQIRENS